MTLNFENIHKKFGSKKVLNDLSFSIQKGEYVGLIGNNGCGKTTTIHLALNLIQPQSGLISFFGKTHHPGKNQFRRQVGIVLSEPYYIENFKVRKYLNFVGKFQNLKKMDILERSTNLINLLNLNGCEKQRIKELSSGNKMKISLIVALLHNPEILVLDEPFTHLDIETTSIITDVLKKIKETKTLLISSHNLDLVINLCDRFLILDNGKIKMDINKIENSNEKLKEKIQSIMATRDKLADIDWLI